MKNNVLLKVFVAIILAVIAGWLTGPTQTIGGISYVKIYNLLGQLFLNALSLVVVPLVAASIITGMARMGNEHSFGKLGIKTFSAYISTSLLAIAVGLLFSLLIAPGLAQQGSLSTTAGIDSSLATLANSASQGDAFDKISQILFKLVPPNIFAAAAQGQMLGLIFFCLLFGFFVSKVEERVSSVVLNFFQGIFQVMMRITQFIMKALPFGVFGLVAKVIATTGFEAIQSVALFFVTVLLSLATFSFIVLPAILFCFRINPILYFRAVAPALFTAFSTSSSAAALPIAIECVEKRAGVSNRICSFTIPLGASLNFSGTALYQCAAAFFIAQAYGVDLSASTLIIITLMALLTSTGMAGIPSSSLISIVIILTTIGVPAEGIGLILAVERILDMCRTAVNVLGNTCCSVLIARSEGEFNVLTNSALLNQNSKAIG